MEPSRVQCLEAQRRKQAAGITRSHPLTPWAITIRRTLRCSWIYEPPKIKLLACCNQFNTSNKWRRKNCRIFCLIMTNPIKVCNSPSIYILRTDRISSERSSEVSKIASARRSLEVKTLSCLVLLAWCRQPIHKTSISRLWKEAKQMLAFEGNMATPSSITMWVIIHWVGQVSIAQSTMLERSTTEGVLLMHSIAQWRCAARCTIWLEQRQSTHESNLSEFHDLTETTQMMA